GSHIPEVFQYADEKGWDVDFYMTCFYNLSRGPRESALVGAAPGMVEERYLDEDRERMCALIQQTRKQCLAFKILAAGRKCATQEMVREAFRFAFAQIKPTDAVVVGMFPKYIDQIALNVEHARHAMGAC
ncbi:MAG: hypothetical protein QHJ73_18385, partial [Armatimonadota bacterium]|nr:hypothetical protein [Armatimonadota bacterium]